MKNPFIMNPSLEWKTAEKNTFQTFLSNFLGRMIFRSKVIVFLLKKKCFSFFQVQINFTV